MVLLRRHEPYSLSSSNHSTVFQAIIYVGIGWLIPSTFFSKAPAAHPSQLTTTAKTKEPKRVENVVDIKSGTFIYLLSMSEIIAFPPLFGHGVFTSHMGTSLSNR